MRQTRIRNLATRAATAGRYCAGAWHRAVHIREASNKAVLMASFFVMAGVLLVSSGAPVLAANLPAVDKQIQAGANDLHSFVGSSKPTDLRDKPGIESRLNGAIGHDNWWDGSRNLEDCKVIAQLTDLLRYIEKLRGEKRTGNGELEELYTRVWMMRNDILQSIPADMACRGYESVSKEPVTRVDSSDNKHVNLNVAFAPPTLTTVVSPTGQNFTRVHLPGIENMVGTPGEPAIPTWQKLIAIPVGSTPRVKVSRAERGETLRVNLAPFQEQAVDQENPNQPPRPDDPAFADKPWQLNKKSYELNKAVPNLPCSITPMGQYRDIQMAQLSCATGQYNAVTDQFIMHKSVDIDVSFEGGDGYFATDRSFNEFESASALTTSAALNAGVISKYVKDLEISDRICWGEELLILTHSTFREAADRLATHKRASGISTSVFNVGNGVPSRDTAEEIDDFIENRYDDCAVRPSYVMLMGDAEFVPTFYRADMPDNPGTDFPYSNYVQILFDAFFPDFGTGRIPVDTLAQANTVVDKIVKYEADPPFVNFGNGGPFYNSVGLASQFQCCRMNADGTPLNNQAGTDQRAFIQTSEFVRDELVDRGYNVPRIYTRTVDGGGYCIQQNSSGVCTRTQAAYSGDSTPRRYFNGSLLPSAIGAGSGFAWNGTTANITSAWNAGRFLFVHRDHGWPGGWADPGFSTSSVNALSNGDLLPVVFSVNCASGLFDNETAGGVYGTTNSGVYFAEAALRKSDGGAIGIIGDTRNSPTWANNALTRGFFDAVWPDTVPTHGGNVSHKRLGDILNWGKVYLAGQVGVPQPAGSVTVDNMGYEYNIWNLIGDPTLKMWTQNPYRLILDRTFTTKVSRLGEIISYKQKGATITKLQVSRDGSTKAIGRAVVNADGKANMDYFQQPEDGGTFVYSASLDGSASMMIREAGTAPTR